MTDELIILLPAYNEEENLSTLVTAWQEQKALLLTKYGLKLKIFVVNDGSSDSTKEICQRLSRQDSDFTYVNHPVNKGLGEALKTAVLHVVRDCPKCRFACVMDCDNTQDPKYIRRLLDKIGANQEKLNADVIIASRYRRGSGVQGVKRYRLLASEGARFVYSAILHVRNVRDYTCGYRLYTRDSLSRCCQRFNASVIEEQGFACMAELLYKLYLTGASFDEIPFVLRYDFKQGKSKMKVIKTAINSIRLVFRLKGQKKP